MFAKSTVRLKFLKKRKNRKKREWNSITLTTLEKKGAYLPSGTDSCLSVAATQNCEIDPKLLCVSPGRQKKEERREVVAILAVLFYSLYLKAQPTKKLHKVKARRLFPGNMGWGVTTRIGCFESCWRSLLWTHNISWSWSWSSNTATRMQSANSQFDAGKHWWLVGNKIEMRWLNSIIERNGHELRKPVSVDCGLACCSSWAKSRNVF